MDRDPILQGELVRLRPLELSDAESLHEIYREPQTMRYYGKPVCATLDDTRRLIGQMLQGQANGSGVRWAILQHTDSIVVGSIGFHGWDRDRGFAFFSYEIVPQHRGKHLSVDAGRVALALGASTMGLRRILAVIDADNLASVATAKRLGFALESGLDPLRSTDDLNRCTFSLSVAANAIPVLEF